MLRLRSPQNPFNTLLTHHSMGGEMGEIVQSLYSIARMMLHDDFSEEWCSLSFRETVSEYLNNITTTIVHQ